MPTGYTEQLKEMKYDTKDWLLRIIPRNFGCAVMLRDDPFDLPLDEIIKRVGDSANSKYHSEALEREETEYQKFKSMSDSEWESSRDQEYRAREKAHNEYVAEANTLRDNHQVSIDKINVLLSRASDEYKSMLIFAKDQLVSTVAHDCSITPLSPKLDLERYKQVRLEVLQDSIKYHRDHLIKSLERERERLEFLRGWISFINSNMSH